MKIGLKNLEVQSFITATPVGEVRGGAVAGGGVVLRDETIPPYCPDKTGDDNCR